MSGGFFRGTSADQDTRFSNKQAKLLKTQKFATELNHLVDMTKVKMDVMKPWIATRVTELLGFEDEVLINFIYGLLEPKDVNGKEVQISLTGFMEKHTAKFMKELWMLLLSAQKNASGVPQQFLDAKEEETRKKKLEADRIANEIQKKKEKESRELDQQRSRNMDGAVEMKATNSASDPNSKTILEKDSISYPKDEKEDGERSSVRGRTSDRRKSRSVSRSPKRRKSSPRRGSITPRKRYSPRSSRSPLRTSYFRQRSRSRSPRRSPSPLRHRLGSPFLRKSPLPRHRRSPSPFRRQRSPSPVRRRRSPSPVRRRTSPSPVRRRRSPSPVRRRRSPSPIRRRRSPSPIRHRRSPLPAQHHRFPSSVQHGRSPSPLQRYQSPLRMRRAAPSPLQHRSPSPTRRLSRSPVQHRPLSPMRHRYQRSPLLRHRSPSPIEHMSLVSSRLRSPTHSQRRSPPYESSSPSPARHRNLSTVRRESPNDGRRSPAHSPRGKYGNHEKLSPVARQPSSSLRSPQRDPKDRKYLHKKGSAFSPSPERSPTVSESPLRLTRKRGTGKDKRSFSLDENPVRQTTERVARDDGTSPSPRSRERRTLQDGPETSKEDKETNHARADGDHKSVQLHGRSARISRVSKLRESPMHDLNKKDHSPGSERLSGRGDHPETFEQQRSPALYEDSLSGDRQWSTYPGESKISERNFLHKNNGKDRDVRCKTENATMGVENVDQNNRNDSFDSGSPESYKHKAKIKEKRKHKKHDREEVASDDDYSYDSEMDKEAKRRKEEKKLRREEKRRRRDERRRRKEERRAAKLKMRNQSDADASDDEHVPRRENHPSHDEETESAQKKT